MLDHHATESNMFISTSTYMPARQRYSSYAPSGVGAMPAGLQIKLGATHLYGAEDGSLVMHCAHSCTLWALNQEDVPVARICREQPVGAISKRSDQDGTFWIDLRDSLTKTIALGCEWLEPVDRDHSSGLFLAQINFLMIPAEAATFFQLRPTFLREESHAL